MRIVILIAVAGLLLTAVKWAFLAGRRLPRHRVRYLRLRLRLRLHPGKGHATVFELWWRWGRLAMFRHARRTRPSLTSGQRAAAPRVGVLVTGRPRALPARAAASAGGARGHLQPAARRQDRLAGPGHPALPRPGAVHHHQARRVRADQRRPRRPRPGARVQPAGHRRRAVHVPVEPARRLPGPGRRDPPGRRVRQLGQPAAASRTPASGPPRPPTTCAATSTPPRWPGWTCGTSPAGSPAPAQAKPRRSSTPRPAPPRTWPTSSPSCAARPTRPSPPSG